MSNLSFSFSLNYPEFPDSCPRLKFTFFKDILNIFNREKTISPVDTGADKAYFRV